MVQRRGDAINDMDGAVCIMMLLRCSYSRCRNFDARLICDCREHNDLLTFESFEDVGRLDRMLVGEDGFVKVCRSMMSMKSESYTYIYIHIYCWKVAEVSSF